MGLRARGCRGAARGWAAVGGAASDDRGCVFSRIAGSEHTTRASPCWQWASSMVASPVPRRIGRLRTPGDMCAPTSQPSVRSDGCACVSAGNALVAAGSSTCRSPAPIPGVMRFHLCPSSCAAGCREEGAAHAAAAVMGVTGPGGRSDPFTLWCTLRASPRRPAAGSSERTRRPALSNLVARGRRSCRAGDSGCRCDI